MCACHCDPLRQSALNMQPSVAILAFGMLQFYERLRAAVGAESVEDVAARTDTAVALTRSYFNGAPLDPGFLATFCRQYGVSSEWLLHGTGPMRQSDVPRFAVLGARSSSCLQSIAAETDRLTDRLDRVETLLNTLDLQLRVATKNSCPNSSAASPADSRL